ncbi:MAG: hypothetical protein LC637_11500 [Xanthomonadaceae bacterium]|nr:hypothetical protein [Xanthomonadaceae bacterium]
MNGTMWRVDFNEAGNGSSRYANGLFTTQNNRPITSAPALAANPNGGMMVYFGTGKLIETVDRLQSGIELETMYAIRDRERDVPFTQLGNPEISIVDGQRTIIGETGPLGWALRLSPSTVATGERVLARPRVIFGQVIFTTFEPEDDPCAPGGGQRVYVINALTGAGELDNICPNCAVVELGIGAPVDPAVVIVPPSDPDFGGGGGDPTDPDPDPDVDPPGDDSAGAANRWCPILSAITDATTGPIGLRPICEGRQIWRQVR